LIKDSPLCAVIDVDFSPIATQGSTALLEACYRGHTASVKLLLDAGANQDGEVYEVCHAYTAAIPYKADTRVMASDLKGAPFLDLLP